jgi:hypothetical protein
MQMTGQGLAFRYKDTFAKQFLQDIFPVRKTCAAELIKK